MSAEALREQAAAMRAMADELERIAHHMDGQILLSEAEVLSMQADYTPDHDALVLEVTSEFPEVQPDELVPLSPFERPTHVIYVRKSLNVMKVVDDARYLCGQGKLVAFEFPDGSKFKLVPHAGTD